MTVEEPQPNIFKVFYWVDLSDPFQPRCDCKAGDYGRSCHHIKAAQAFRDGELYYHGDDDDGA